MQDLPKIQLEATELIICPACEAQQMATARLYNGSPWWSYVHTCDQCGYIITESEWQPVVFAEGVDYEVPA